MKLLNKLTLKSLRLNMKRTVVTVIGIILATALLSAVSTMAVSFQGSMVEYEKKTNGDFHYAFYNVDPEEVSAIENNRKLDSYFEMVGIGYAMLPGCVNPDKPYLYLAAMDEDAFSRATVELVEGRLPENDSEVIISKHIKTNGGVEYHVGDTLTLDIGGRYWKERADTDIDQDWFHKPMNQWQPNSEGYDTEELRTDFTKTYTIVGITERLDMGNFEDRMAPGYTILTHMEKGGWKNLDQIYDGVDIFVRYIHTGRQEKLRTTAEILGIDPDWFIGWNDSTLTVEEYDRYSEEMENSITDTYKENRYLLRYETLDFTESTMRVLYGVAAIVMLIIVFSSAFCIRNSFAISITDKMRQYGMLASVGATPRQIRKNVFYEAFILAVSGIPLGILSGLFASWVLIKVVGMLLGGSLGLDITFHASGFAIALSVVFAAAMILLSAARPARHAGKVSPIVAINDTTNVKLTRKALKIPGFVKKIFGIGGVLAYKNMRRNKKSYRVVVVSMAVSVSTFVALSYFIQLAFDSSSYYTRQHSYNLQLYANELSYENMRRIAEWEGVRQATICRSVYINISRKDIPFTEKGLQYAQPGEEEEIYVNICSLGEREYARYLGKLGFTPEEMGDRIVYINESFEYNVEEQKYEVYAITSLKSGDKMDAILKVEGPEGDTENEISFEIGCVTGERPFGMESWDDCYGGIIVSDQWMNRHPELNRNFSILYLDCVDADRVQEEVVRDGLIAETYIYNLAKEQRDEQSLYLVIAIFLYGFITVISLIGITNIFNTVTKNMELRSREFAMLRSIGMTGREFNRMVCMESIFYGGKSLFFGLAIGLALSGAIYQAMKGGLDVGYRFPMSGVLIAVLAVAALLFAIMRYSLVRIRRQNIIETIRQENI